MAAGDILSGLARELPAAQLTAVRSAPGQARRSAAGTELEGALHAETARQAIGEARREGVAAAIGVDGRAGRRRCAPAATGAGARAVAAAALALGEDHEPGLVPRARQLAALDLVISAQHERVERDAV